MKMWSRCFILCWLSVGCIQAPTTSSDSDASLLQRAYEFEKNSRPIKITPETIVLDTRTFFDYQILRIPSSLYVDASEFSLRKRHGDELEKQAIKLARRFALMGINPFSHVVIVGYGAKGKGEEGLVALTLLALGVERVQVGTFNGFKFLASNKQAPAPQNKRYWEPKLVASVSCPSHSMADGLVVDVSGKSGGPISLSDRRMAKVSKDWKDFVNPDDFSPNYKARDFLKGHSLNDNALVMVRGQQAPLVVFSMLQLGYKNTCMMDE